MFDGDEYTTSDPMSFLVFKTVYKQNKNMFIKTKKVRKKEKRLLLGLLLNHKLFIISMYILFLKTKKRKKREKKSFIIIDDQP